RIALRSKCTAVIADAEDVERAAETFRAAALEAEKAETRDVTLVPALPSVEKSREPAKPVSAKNCSDVDDLYPACQWLATTQTSFSKFGAEGGRQESLIAMRVLELQDRQVASDNNGTKRKPN